MTAPIRAQSYARRGWPTFPIDPATKRPLTAHCFHDATTDLPTLAEWQRRYPTAGIGLATGSPSAAAKELDCSSSSSLALHAAGLMDGVSGPQVSGWFANWGQPGEGKRMTVWWSTEHTEIEFTGCPRLRFSTSPYGQGPNGPHLRSNTRDYSSLSPRHWGGT